MKNYLIEALMYVHNLCDVGGRLEQIWTYASTDAQEATKEFDAVLNDQRSAAVALIEWEPGRLIEPNRANMQLKLGDIACRNCAGGFPVAKVIKWADRTFSAYTRPGSTKTEFKIGEWDIHTDPVKLTPGCGPELLTLTPKEG